MQKIEVYNALNHPNEKEKKEIVNFLFENLEEYGDPKAHIQKALEYSTKEISSFGGFTLLLKESSKIHGVVVINCTGMGGYIPENILVYIATAKEFRGMGIGKVLMERTIELTNGDIALHVEEDNPAIHLYKKYGFTNPYLEMRLAK